jgi:DNA-binding response OmpR family regulator
MISSPEAGTLLPGINEFQWYPERRKLMIKNRQISLTRTEYQLLTPLGLGEPVTYADLAMRVYQCLVDQNVRIMLDKHIDRIRGKLRGTGIYIYCVLGYGYILLPEKDLDA